MRPAKCPQRDPSTPAASRRRDDLGPTPRRLHRSRWNTAMCHRPPEPRPSTRLARQHILLSAEVRSQYRHRGHSTTARALGRQGNGIAYRKNQNPPVRNRWLSLHKCRESHSERLGATPVASVPPDALHGRSAPTRSNTNPSEASSRTMKMLLRRSSAAPHHPAGLVDCHWLPCTCANLLGSCDNR